MEVIVNIDNVTLQSKRLLLRQWNYDDLDDFYEYAQVDGVGQKAGWIPHKNKQETKTILDLFINTHRTFAIVYKENNKVIGSIGLEKRNEYLDESYDNLIGLELGYVLSKDYWGQGIMVEAVKETIKYCFDNLELDFLTCAHFDHNTQSKRVIEKCGFVYYKNIVFKTRMDTIENSLLYILINPIKESIRTFVKKSNLDINNYISFYFGSKEIADELCQCVLDGDKQATTSLYFLYEKENDPLPKVGDYSVILNSKKEPKCIIQNEKVYFKKFKDIDEAYALKEGEGDKSLDYWRNGHLYFFNMYCNQYNLTFNEDMLVVCEEFKMIYKPSE